MDALLLISSNFWQTIWKVKKILKKTFDGSLKLVFCELAKWSNLIIFSKSLLIEFNEVSEDFHLGTPENMHPLEKTKTCLVWYFNLLYPSMQVPINLLKFQWIPPISHKSDSKMMWFRCPSTFMPSITLITTFALSKIQILRQLS